MKTDSNTHLTFNFSHTDVSGVSQFHFVYSMRYMNISHIDNGFYLEKYIFHFKETLILHGDEMTGDKCGA